MNDVRKAMEAAAEALELAREAYEAWGNGTRKIAAALSLLHAALACPRCGGIGEIRHWGSTPAGRPIMEVDACPVCASPVAADTQGDALPPEVIAWRDARREYIEALERYNTRLAAIRAREAQFPSEFGRDNPDTEYRAYTDAQNRAHRLLGPMYEAIKGAAMKEQPSDGAALCAKGPGGCVAGECGKEEKRG